MFSGGRRRPATAAGVYTGRLVAAVLCVGLLAVPPAAPAPVASAEPPTLAASGYFRVTEIHGIWWLVDPAGHATLSIGVNNVSYAGDRIHGTGAAPYLATVERRYGSRDEWSAAARRRLQTWGFNTLGAWSDGSLDGTMPYTVMLDVAVGAGARWSGVPADVFAPAFDATARAIAHREAEFRTADPMLLGYFSDNELWWGSDWRNRRTMLAAYLSFPEDAPGRREAVAFLRGRYGTIRRLNRAWHAAAPDFAHIPAQAGSAAYRADAAAFLGRVAARYFAVSAAAIHAADPNHLYLGARFMGAPPLPVLRAARAADVVSLNLYVRDPRRQVAAVYAATHRPVLVTEFAFRSLDSGLPNTVGAGPWVFTQRNRGEAYMRYVSRLEAMPAVVGYHWFRWEDEPAQGRGDGENSNYGLVDVRDRAYGDLVIATAAANRATPAIHAGAAVSVAVPWAPAWFRWTAADALNTLLGGPRWLSTALRALALFIRRSVLTA